MEKKPQLRAWFGKVDTPNAKQTAPANTMTTLAQFERLSLFMLGNGDVSAKIESDIKSGACDKHTSRV